MLRERVVAIVTRWSLSLNSVLSNKPLTSETIIYYDHGIRILERTLPHLLSTVESELKN